MFKMIRVNFFRAEILFVIGCLFLHSSCRSFSGDTLSGQLEEQTETCELPDYYFDNNYLNDIVSRINNVLSDDPGSKSAFFWITDIHWEKSYNTRLSPALIKYLAQETRIDILVDGGDNGNSPEICEDAISHLIEAMGSNRVYSVTGNHELLGSYTKDYPLKLIHKSLRSHNADVIYGDDDNSYFYWDDSIGKMRFIGLSTFNSYDGKKYSSAYNHEQLEWFKNIALDVDSGWTILIFTHSLYYVNIRTDRIGPSPAGAADFIQVIDNYSGKGEIACVLMGHSHKDRMHIGSSGVPYIVSSCDRYLPYEADGIPDINVDRVPGTISEQHFEVVVIDKAKKEVKLFAIGGNARDGYDNGMGDEVNCRTILYE